MPFDIDALAPTIAAVTGLVTAVGVLIISWRNSRATSLVKEKADTAAAAAADAKLAAEDGKKEVVIVRGELIQVGERIDGRLSDLLKLTEESALATGRLEGRAAERANQVERMAVKVETTNEIATKIEETLEKAKIMEPPPK